MWRNTRRNTFNLLSEKAGQAEMHDVSQMLNEAADFHGKGNFAGAESLYLQILKTHSDNFDALHLLGILRYQQGRLTEALSSIGAALNIKPHFPPALLNYAVVLEALGGGG
jgi:tetratricopeptide (TPR) repeat protein